MSNEAENLVAEIQALLAAGRKIEAIKRYREATGAGLAAAKETVEAIERNEPLPERKSLDSAFENEIVGLLEGGKKIEAIKLYRERTGVGLKEAKDAVEAVATQRGILAPSKSGCLGVVLLLTTVSVAALALAGEKANGPVPVATLADALAVIKSKQFVDLTHAFEPGIPHWPGFPDEKRETLYWYDGGTYGQGFLRPAVQPRRPVGHALRSARPFRQGQADHRSDRSQGNDPAVGRDRRS